MKHYALGLVFNKHLSRILLVAKLRPQWMCGRSNGIGGKIEKDEIPSETMLRESKEETGYGFDFEHVITFVCPGGTVYVFKAVSSDADIPFEQMEDETLYEADVAHLPDDIMRNLRWLIPLSLSTVQFPIILHQTDLGVD